MILRDEITQIKLDKQPDGMGGYISTETSRTKIQCKASYNTSPEVATAYGLSSEQVLYIVTSVKLDKEAFYLFKNKRYQIRFQAKNGSRLFYSTFIEVKEDSDV